MSVTLIVVLMLAIPAVVILFALLKKGDVSAALCLDRFSFQLEAKDRRVDCRSVREKRSALNAHGGHRIGRSYEKAVESPEPSTSAVDKW